MSSEMIAYCGLECTSCEAFLATRDHDVGRARATAEAWSLQFGIQVAVEHVWCDGCLVGGQKCAHCGECEIRACARGRAVASCGACDDYPCATVGQLLAMVPDARARLDAIRAARG
jgi:hypothetical protein